ncbi:tryptophan synthase subunit alpha [Desulfonatronovibrio hydrogenovorans]|uniref:tryptophan synthase subunit alpha n=1 Tax=Desulfonatronovibrio hydrogenovorans TaxID=53245 RepID=UPI00048C4A78|nr:tryptophan synthase subunit alpha [Desulfonatronovibrio hydrogenovorans]
MKTDNILTLKIQQALNQGRSALIPFVPAGFPDKDTFRETIMELDRSGADIIEIGVPFSDPVADGPVVEKASIRCLEQGVNLTWIIEKLKSYRTRIKAGIVLMGYFNPFLQYGLERLASEADLAGVNGLIIPDLIFEEAEPYLDTFEQGNLSLVPLVGLNTPRERMQKYAGLNPAFVYLVSVLGITGTRLDADGLLKNKLAEVREVFACPAALGFGLSSREQLKPLAGQVDAVVFGSALIRHLEEGKKAGEFMAAWV